MNFQKFQSPREEKYKNHNFNFKGNYPQISSTGNTNLLSQSNQPKSSNSSQFSNTLIKENQNSIISTNQNLNPISIAELIQEKENLSQALKKEIIKNEEQRNYIKVLKETIESNLFRSGFAEILASSKEYQQFQEYNKGQGKTLADFVVDFIKFKEETNKFKKDLLISNNIISDSKNEIDNLNKKVNDIEKKNLQLINNINKEQNEKEYMLLKDSENNDIINKLNKKIKLLEEENINLKKQIFDFKNINIKKNANISNDIKYKNLLNEYEKIKKEKEEIVVQKEKLEKLYKIVKDENNILTGKYNKLENEFQYLGNSVNEVNNKYNKINSNQDEINKLKLIIDDKNKENQELYDKLNIITSEGDIANIENRNNKQRIKDCLSSIDRLKFEKKVLEDEFANLQEKYENILIEHNESINQNELLTTNFERLKNEYNILLEEKNKQDIELENNINIKYIKEKEIDDMERKFDEDFTKVQKENLELNKSLKNYLDKINDLNDKIYQLKEINEITNKQLREKIENEQILLKENMNYKSSIEDLSTKYNENVNQLENQINNYNDLNKNYITIKTQYNDLQKLLKNSSEEKSKLLETNKKISEDTKNFEEQYKANLVRMEKICKKKFISQSLNDFLKESTEEIIKLEQEKNKLNDTIKQLNLKCFETAQENQNHIEENKKLKNMLSNMTNNYNKDLTEKENILKEIENYKLMNYQLQKTIDDYGVELNKKISDLNNISYTRSEIENKNIKLTNDKEFLLTILLRVTKLFSHSNIYELVNDVFNNSKFNDKDLEYQNHMNQKLLQELQRCEDYVNMLKENDLEANYLNLKLNQEIQNLNLQKLRKENLPYIYNINSDINRRNKYSFNTLNNNKYFLDYSQSNSLNNKTIVD